MPQNRKDAISSLPATNRTPAEQVEDLAQYRIDQRKRLHESLKAAYVVGLRALEDPAPYRAALSERGIRTTKASPHFLPFVKLVMETSDKRASFCAQALQRAYDKNINPQQFQNYLKNTGGVSGPRRQHRRAGQANQLKEVAKMKKRALEFLSDQKPLAKFHPGQSVEQTALLIARRGTRGTLFVKYILDHDEKLLDQALTRVKLDGDVDGDDSEFNGWEE